MDDALPHYAARLDALHQALAEDFRAIVASLPWRGLQQVIDAGCGDGFFTELLAGGVGDGQVIAVDSSAAFLQAAGARLRGPIEAGRVRLVQGDVGALPFDDSSADLVWSAHSMQSYDDLPTVLAEFRRVLRPGGMLAVLESDAMHSIMLPWPARVELAVRQAELRSLGDQDERQGAYFPRYAPQLFRDAGFKEVELRYRFIHRSAPFDQPLQTYVSLYLRDLLTRLGEDLNVQSRQFVERLAGIQDSDRQAPSDEGSFGSLQVLLTARAPE